MRDHDDHLPSNHIGSLVDIWNTVEEALNTSEALSHMRLGIVSIVEIFGHLLVINKLLLYLLL